MKESELASLRGAVRDGVAAIENLANVLASRRVGPRVIERALPEVRGGCLALCTGALEQLRAALPEILVGDVEGIDATNEMLDHAGLRVAELAAELGRRESDSLDARERLALDALVRGISAELAGLVRLVDLLGTVTNPRTTALELSDLLSQKRTLKGAPSTPITVSVDLGTQPTLLGDAYVVLDLLIFALAIAARTGIVNPYLGVSVTDDAHLVIVVGPPRTSSRRRSRSGSSRCRCATRFATRARESSSPPRAVPGSWSPATRWPSGSPSSSDGVSFAVIDGGDGSGLAPPVEDRRSVRGSRPAGVARARARGVRDDRRARSR